MKKKACLIDQWSWKTHLSNWSKYAAATGATLAMATSADAGIIHTTLNITASINPADINTNVNRSFKIAGALESIVLANRSLTGVWLSQRLG